MKGILAIHGLQERYVFQVRTASPTAVVLLLSGWLVVWGSMGC